MEVRCNQRSESTVFQMTREYICDCRTFYFLGADKEATTGKYAKLRPKKSMF